MNRPFEEWDARKYLEYRLFWPYSFGMRGQWMSHQIDTVHWFTGLKHPRSAVANGGIYKWKDGCRNWDTTTAVFDYGLQDDKEKGFQVVFTSKMQKGDENPAEIYYLNGGKLGLITNIVSPKGGLTKEQAAAMGIKKKLLPTLKLAELVKVDAAADTRVDDLVSNHMINWVKCIRSRKTTNAPVEAAYHHSIANKMHLLERAIKQHLTKLSNK